ncbi:putative membrane protein [Natronobacillus azotifigens]|uniref:Carotenoid biosynthesis protein n=1 Tax=Natronobacillus azotifigens TaxID=472978 RepID=A0A9J6R8M9_9BACI|nr:carotenoid biosynthesis protein [Natronobacillus azotifigens]MCZ0701919.1 carotenoid biosynthesis protein [Natronobacillus azotifigens]
MREKPILLPLFIIWYTIGFILQVFFVLPESLAFSKPAFLIFYSLSLVEWIGKKEGGWKKVLLGSIIVALSTFFVEILSVETGFPFGEYSYSTILGPLVVGVPFTIALAWVGVLLNSLIMSSQNNKTKRALETGFWIVIIDLILDPVAVLEGYWTWYNPGAFSYYDIPITNFFTWFILGALLSYLFPLYKRSKQMLRMNTFIYQLMLLLFGALALTHGVLSISIMSVLFILLAEGKYRYDSGK